MNVQKEIRELEGLMGFPISRKKILLDSNEPHDENFSYGLTLRYYGKEEDLKSTIIKANKVLFFLLKKDGDKETKRLLYCLIGNMYYIYGNFNSSAGYFMKALSYDKEDMTSWIEFIFSLRALGNFELFEKVIFNIEKIYGLWKASEEEEMTQDLFMKLMENIK